MNSTDTIEALLFAADRPVPLEKLSAAAEISLEETQAAIEALRDEKKAVGALQVVEVAGGFQLVTKSAFANSIRRLREEKKGRISRAAFEVLAIVAYRQPVTRGEIDTLRGVESGGPLNFLLERKLLVPAGRKESPGKPWLFKTTPQFLESFGLASLDDLPDLEEFSSLEHIGRAPQTVSLFERGTVNMES